MARFGAQRMLPDRSGAERALYRLMGVADPAHFLHGAYFRKALRVLRPSGVRRCLDAGCGAGDYSIYMAQRFPQAEVTGLDLDAARIEKNQATRVQMGLDNLRFEVADLTRLEFENEFDLIVCVDVLEHIPDQPEAIRRLYRALVPGGCAFLHIPTIRTRPVPFHGFLKGFLEWGEDEHLAEDLTAEEFRSRLVAAGFQVEWEKRTFGYFTGEMATSVFMLPFENTGVNRVLQGLLSVPCRGLAYLDALGIESTRYGVGLALRKP